MQHLIGFAIPVLRACYTTEYVNKGSKIVIVESDSSIKMFYNLDIFKVVFHSLVLDKNVRTRLNNSQDLTDITLEWNQHFRVFSPM